MNDIAVQVASVLIRRFEGLRLTPYLCPAGVASVGFGSTRYEDGRHVQLTDPPITRKRAEQLMLWSVKNAYLPAVLKLCPGVPDAYKLAALIDFTFNLGAGRLRVSTLRKRVNAQDWAAVPSELRKWTRGGGKVLKGLVARREAEVALVQKVGA